MDAEHWRQLLFRIFKLFQIFALGLAVWICWQQLRAHFSRQVLGPRSVSIEFKPVPAAIESAAFRISGAWEMEIADSRFGGFSGIAISGDRLLGITDSGVVAAFDKPGAASPKAVLKELPAGPKSMKTRWAWDTEAVEPASDGSGFWVSFEQTHQLWLYDRSFDRALRQVRLGQRRWPYNLGVEGLVADRSALLLFIEARSRIGRLEGGLVRFQKVTGLLGRFSEAERLPDGRVIALERRLTPAGFRNALVEVERAGDHYTVARRHPLMLGPIDNMEGLAAELLPNGATRLWVISDDNYQRPLRTLLLAIDLQPPKAPSS